ncbi:hypothetical protein Ahy_A07g036039 [Arachis hypogaea]|uniref:Uncharacterized protein n=1 Tax=Arachis hypogaea TaxID=3818 RepID=A0A445CF24_ARAHY|nr:hypothetical protein Ahy_A07g036039 [Arachis hypogaea]
MHVQVMLKNTAKEQKKLSLHLLFETSKERRTLFLLEESENPNPPNLNPSESETHRTTPLLEGVNRTIIASHQEAPNRKSPSSHHHRRCAAFFPNRRCLILPGVAEFLLSAVSVLLPSSRLHCFSTASLISPVLLLLCCFYLATSASVSWLIVDCALLLLLRCYWFAALAVCGLSSVAKFIIPTKGKRIALARINDNWRRYKTTIKKNHFLPYKCVNEMLKIVLKAYLRRTEKVKKMSAQNKKNRAQQKFSHRKGLINFVRTRARLVVSKENNEPPTQAEIFVETRQSTKEKSLDEETLDVIAHLQAENKKCKESAIRAFQSIFGKEKAGRVRCHGRVTTPTLLKKNEEIVTLKQQHATEKASLEGKVDVMQKEVDELKSLVKMMLQQKSSGVDLEMLASQLGSTLCNPNNDAHEEENYVEGEIELD